jgi:chemotaxis protein methyltransferase WspC
MKVIERLLRDRIGLDPSSLGSSMLDRTVRLRMKALGVQRVHDYRHLLERSALEWDALVESVVVPETWFFRDRQPFTRLARLVLAERSPTHPTTPLRLLSVPCSTGEEPYSMAMALLDAGLPALCLHIDAVDISARALAVARRAVYGRNSFRGGDLSYRERHFQSEKEGFALRSAARGVVHFCQGNLLDDAFPGMAAPYDFIFCRNLLIYFDAAARAKALRQLERLLAERGVLFVGAAELPLVVKHGFVSANLPTAFACYKIGPTRAVRTKPVQLAAVAAGRKSAASFASLPTAATTTRGALLEKTFALPHPPAATRRAPSDEIPDDALSLARHLANTGQLRQATAVCEAYLKEHGACAQAYFLLGLLADTQGLASAYEYYRRALYLDPNHYDALVRMALLCEKRGEAARARTLSRRAERLEQKI